MYKANMFCEDSKENIELLESLDIVLLQYYDDCYYTVVIPDKECIDALSGIEEFKVEDVEEVFVKPVFLIIQEGMEIIFYWLPDLDYMEYECIIKCHMLIMGIDYDDEDIDNLVNLYLPELLEKFEDNKVEYVIGNPFAVKDLDVKDIVIVYIFKE